MLNSVAEPDTWSEKGLPQPPVYSELPIKADDTSTLNPSTPQIHLFKSQIILNPTITRINYAAMLGYSFFMTFILIPSGLLGRPLLSIVYGLSSSQQIDTMTAGSILTTVLKIMYLPFLGPLCDRFGRKPFIVTGITCLTASIALSPHLPSIFPYYYLNAVINEFGLSCMLTPPLLADYIDYETKGRAAALGAVIAAIASFLGSFLLETINLKANIPAKYHQLAIFALVLGLLIIIGLKGGPYHKTLSIDRKAEEAKKKAAELIEQENQVLESQQFAAEDKDNQNKELQSAFVKKMNTTSSIHPHKHNQALDMIEEEQRLRNEKPNLMTGFKEAKRNSWILIGYITAFLFYSVVMLVNSVLVNYVIDVTGNVDDATQAYVLTNKQIICTIFAGIVFGLIADRCSKFKIIIFVILSSFVAVLLLILSPTPYNFMAYLSMLFFGITMAGFETFNSQVISKYSNPRYRASVAAVASVSNALGGVTTNILGVYLSQFYTLIPFLLYLVVATIGLLAIIFVYSRKRDVLSKI